ARVSAGGEADDAARRSDMDIGGGLEARFDASARDAGDDDARAVGIERVDQNADRADSGLELPDGAAVGDVDHGLAELVADREGMLGLDGRALAGDVEARVERGIRGEQPDEDRAVLELGEIAADRLDEPAVRYGHRAVHGAEGHVDV